jgi:hypothetical protein
MTIRAGTLALAIAAIAVGAGIAHAGDNVARTGASDAALIRRIDRLAGQQKALQDRVERLEREKAQTENELAREKENLARMRAAAAEKLADIPALEKEVKQAEAKISGGVPTTEWGTRVGYQGFPFGQRQGGFFYSIYVDHRLLGMDAGQLRWGDLSGEVSVGLGKSGSDHLTVTPSLLGGKKFDVEYRQTMLSVWPALK